MNSRLESYRSSFACKTTCNCCYERNSRIPLRTGIQTRDLTPNRRAKWFNKTLHPFCRHSVALGVSDQDTGAISIRDKPLDVRIRRRPTLRASSKLRRRFGWNEVSLELETVRRYTSPKRERARKCIQPDNPIFRLTKNLYP